MQAMPNEREKQHGEYELHARKIWGHDADPMSGNSSAPATAAMIPAVTIIADAANAPVQTDNHGSASQIDNSIPTTSAGSPVKDGKVSASMPVVHKPGDMPIVNIAAGKVPVGTAMDGSKDAMSPDSAYRDAWNE